MKTKTWERKGEGLYLHTPSGRYYSRYKLNGKPVLKVLDKASNVTTARILHHMRMAGVGETRAKEGGTPTSPLATLGDCTRVLREQLVTSQQGPRTKTGYLDQLDVLEAQWQLGVYSNTHPAKVTREVVIELRDHLLKRAKWKGHNKKRTVTGYSPAYTNQVLARLGSVLAIARHHGLAHDDPFDAGSGLAGSVWARVRSKKVDLPDRGMMERVFAEIVNVRQGPNEEPAFIKWRQERAMEASEHARFLAYSGARLWEGNAATWEDDRGDLIWIHGTKSSPRDRVSRDRLIPQVPALRALLDEIKARRYPGGTPPPKERILVPETSRDALKKACERLKVPKLGHHDLRHYCATVCIESGIDIPTVSRWLGHKDGGVLAMRVYGHLRRDHSLASAAKVSFAPRP